MHFRYWLGRSTSAHLEIHRGCLNAFLWALFSFIYQVVPVLCAFETFLYFPSLSRCVAYWPSYLLQDQPCIPFVLLCRNLSVVLGRFFLPVGDTQRIYIPPPFFFSSSAEREKERNGFHERAIRNPPSAFSPLSLLTYTLHPPNHKLKCAAAIAFFPRPPLLPRSRGSFLPPLSTFLL